MESMQICLAVSFQILRQHCVTLVRSINETFINFKSLKKYFRKNFVPKLTECGNGLLVSYFLKFSN